MKLVATVHAAANLESAVDAFGAAAGLTRAEARMRLVTEPPMLLASLPPEPAEALVRALRQAGLGVLMTLASQGLKTSRTVERTERSQQEETEQVLFVYGRGGQRIALRERELDFSCLGAAMQPTRMANMVALARLLKEKAPGAFYDERLVRLGRRPLPPFVGSGESLAQVGKTAQKRLDTSRGLDVLAEVLWRGVVAGLLP